MLKKQINETMVSLKVDNIDIEYLEHFIGYNSADSQQESEEETKKKDFKKKDPMDLEIERVNEELKINPGKNTWNVFKVLVSKNKNRFVQDKFDLDLTYITSQIIAMGYPSENFEAVYRNSILDVGTFFQKRHKNRYRIYNLCSERKYDVSHFDKASVCEDFSFDDHNPPPFEMIFKFCQDCNSWLEGGPDYIAAIHCKAGKGRTGVMISCYLVFEAHQRQINPEYYADDKKQKFRIKSSLDALLYYGKIRTKDGEGVTIPSQIRYVYYFEHYLKLLRYKIKQQQMLQQDKNKIIRLREMNFKMPRVVMKLYKIRAITTPYIDKGGWIPSYKVYCKYTLFYDSAQHSQPQFVIDQPHTDFIPVFNRKKTKEDGDQVSEKSEEKNAEFNPEDQVVVYDDVKIEFYQGKNQEKKLFQFWFHTSFVDSNGILLIDRDMNDGAHKDRKGKKYDKNFQLKVQMSRINQYQMLEKSLPKMPRKIKYSKSKLEKKNRANSQKRGKSTSSASSVDEKSKTEEMEENNNLIVQVPVETMTNKQIDMLKLAQSLKTSTFQISL